MPNTARYVQEFDRPPQTEPGRVFSSDGDGSRPWTERQSRGADIMTLGSPLPALDRAATQVTIAPPQTAPSGGGVHRRGTSTTARSIHSTDRDRSIHSTDRGIDRRPVGWGFSDVEALSFQPHRSGAILLSRFSGVFRPFSDRFSTDSGLFLTSLLLPQATSRTVPCHRGRLGQALRSASK